MRSTGHSVTRFSSSPAVYAEARVGIPQPSVQGRKEDKHHQPVAVHLTKHILPAMFSRNVVPGSREKQIAQDMDAIVRGIAV